MDTQQTGSRSPLLPVGITMVMLVFGFSFGDGQVLWLWHSQANVAVLVAAVGAVMIAGHAMMRLRRRSPQ